MNVIFYLNAPKYCQCTFLFWRVKVPLNIFALLNVQKAAHYHTLLALFCCGYL